MTRKEIAITFLQMAGSGNVRAAYAKYIAPNLKHHNAYYPGDAESLAKGMEESHINLPDKVFEVKYALEDGDMVAVYSRFRLNPEADDMAVCHLFRFEGDLIAEMWDIGQALPEDSPNQNGLF